MRKEEIKS